jgi:hypothetical protein
MNATTVINRNYEGLEIVCENKLDFVKSSIILSNIYDVDADVIDACSDFMNSNGHKLNVEAWFDFAQDIAQK